MFLITGATGVVGRALCAALDGRGLPFRPLSREPRPGHFTIGTMTPQTAWGEALEGADCVIHLAARVHVMREQGADPLGAYRRDNVETTLNLARQAAAAGVRRLVFLSTIKVNGEETAPGRPFTEADAPAPQGPYAQSKHEAETALAALSAETAMELVTIRPPLVYGPGVRANFRAMLQALRLGLPLPFAALDNRRSLVAVDNLADLIIACASHPRAAGQLILAADGEDLSTPQLLSVLAEAMGRKARLFAVPPGMLMAAARLVGRRDAMRRLTGSLQVDTTRARTLLGWQPPVAAGEALAATARDYLTSVQN
jgi:nucleoside-diphosphate-sugar epimerase